MLSENIKVIAFDADDTLWENEAYFRDAEKELCELLSDYLPKDICNQLLFDIEIKNLPLYGYGIKPFILTLIEAAISFSKGKVPISVIQKLINMGKEILEAPVVVIEGVEETLRKLSEKYKLVVATKGDLLDQARKLEVSGLSKYFHHIEIVANKTEKEYQKLVDHLDIAPQNFLMIGNSVKSDILPVLQIGGHAFHVPFYITWAHERVNKPVEHPNFKLLNHIREALALL